MNNKDKGLEEVKEAKRSWITDGLIIASFTAISYTYAYLYEKGYAEVFDIPTDLIEINLISIMVVALLLMGVFAYLFIIADVIVKKATRLSKALIVKLSVLSVPLILLILQLLIYGVRKWERLIVSAVLGVIVILYEFVRPLFTQRNKKTFKEKLEVDYETRIDKKGIFDYIPVSKIIRKRILSVVLVFCIGYLASYNIGQAVAIYKEKFLIANIPPEVVVLKTYGEKMICAPLNRGKKEIKSSFYIFKIKEDPKMIFSYEKVGPLHVSKTEQ
jgi:phage shock protein PspC (stress-responsive transcriptional regulator)